MPRFSHLIRLSFAPLVGCFALLLSATVAPAVQVPGATCGDPGADGITATDGLIILNVAIGLQQCDVCICDVDGSGDVTATDSLLVLRAAVGSAVELRCPACVPDSSTSTSSSTTTTMTTTTTTMSSGEGDPLPKDDVCDVEFRAVGSDLVGLLVFNVFYDPGLGDFERDGAVIQCHSIPSGGATASGVDGDQAPGHVQLSFIIAGGLPLPSPVMGCSFIASAGGVNTSIFSMTVKTATNPFFQPIPVTLEVSGADCGSN